MWAWSGRGHLMLTSCEYRQEVGVEPQGLMGKGIFYKQVMIVT